MSWSIGFIGKTVNVVAAMKSEVEKMSGQSKEEYEQALPHLVALTEQNFVSEGSGYKEAVIKINASGSGSTALGKQVTGQVSVQLERIWNEAV
ncbi:MAG: hypothetical protein Q8L88_02475 [Bacteroidota bacterium]|nr:hypothetical protein [Bacteroidota bacterium]